MLFLSLKYTDINAVVSRARCQDERWPDEDERAVLSTMNVIRHLVQFNGE